MAMRMVFISIWQVRQVYDAIVSIGDVERVAGSLGWSGVDPLSAVGGGGDGGNDAVPALHVRCKKSADLLSRPTPAPFGYLEAGVPRACVSLAMQSPQGNLSSRSRMVQFIGRAPKAVSRSHIRRLEAPPLGARQQLNGNGRERHGRGRGTRPIPTRVLECSENHRICYDGKLAIDKV